MSTSLDVQLRSSQRVVRAHRGAAVLGPLLLQPLPAVRGRNFPEGKLLFECKSAAIPYAFAIQCCDVASDDSPGDAKSPGGTKLQLDASSWKEAPVGLDERATRREIDYVRRPSRLQSRMAQPRVRER